VTFASIKSRVNRSMIVIPNATTGASAPHRMDVLTCVPRLPTARNVPYSAQGSVTITRTFPATLITVLRRAAGGSRARLLTVYRAELRSGPLLVAVYWSAQSAQLSVPTATLITVLRGDAGGSRARLHVIRATPSIEYPTGPSIPVGVSTRVVNRLANIERVCND
jgi:hypothetical protein